MTKTVQVVSLLSLLLSEELELQEALQRGTVMNGTVKVKLTGQL